MSKLISILILVLSTNLTYGQGFIKMDTIDTPDELNEIVYMPIKRTIQVDFNGDGFDDYICQLDFQSETSLGYREIWFSSSFEKVNSNYRFLMDYDYFWFINLDSDPEPEIFSASGYSDGIDYCFIDQDLKTGKDSILFYFTPVILDSENKNWGYPWDIKDLRIKVVKGFIKIKCSLDHMINRDGEISRPDWQSQFPVICFSGQSTQPDINIGQINEFEWLTISEIMDKVIIANEK